MYIFPIEMIDFNVPRSGWAVSILKKNDQILQMLESFPPTQDASQMSYMLLFFFIFSAGSVLIIIVSIMGQKSAR